MTPTPRAEPTSAAGSDKAQATRAALIDLAAQLFIEKGYAQTSVRDISRRGAVTTGAIYGHFRNKAELLAEVISVRTAEELEAQSLNLAEQGADLDHVETLTRLARDFGKRRQLRALIVEGAAAAHTDEDTRQRLREEQQAHLTAWINAYKRERTRMGIDDEVDIKAAVLYTWAAEIGLGVLEALGITPTASGWADVQNRLARGLQLSPDTEFRRAPRGAKRKRTHR